MLKTLEIFSTSCFLTVISILKQYVVTPIVLFYKYDITYKSNNFKTHCFCLQQEGSLCAQHCLNALLQGPYFTPVDLASLAQRMDDEERLRMSESGVDSDEYRRFLEVV